MRTDVARYTRIGVFLAFVLVVITAAGCRGLKLPGSAALGGDDWVTTGGASTRNGIRDVAFRPPLERAWVRKTTAGFGAASAIGVSDVVLVGNLRGEITAFGLRDGKKKGRRKLASAMEGGSGVSGSVMVVPNAWGRKVLVAYDLHRGKAIWAKRGIPVEASVLPLGSVFVVADIEGNLRSFRTGDGEELWVHETDPTAGYFSSPAANGSVVVAANNRGEVVAVDLKSGELVWSTSVGAPIYSGLAIWENLVYVPTTEGALLALDSGSGEEKWRFESGNSLVRITDPAVSDNRVVVGSTDGTVRAFDSSSGTPLWTSDLGTAISSAPINVSDFIYVGDHQGRLSALAAETGEVVWTDILKGRIKSALAYQNGYLVVLSEPRHVYAFKMPE